MKTITIVSLAGGQGKTTTAFFLAKLLAAQSHNVLVIDADPQANLTFYFNHEVKKDEPTLLEMLTKKDGIDPEDCLYEVPHQNLLLIPADRELENAQHFLAKSGTGAFTLGKRLRPLQNHFDYCIIDSPPARSQLSRTTIGAADWLLIPAEVSLKGLGSIIDTFDFIDRLEEDADLPGSVLGVLPFRDKWFGRNQSQETKEAKEMINETAEKLRFTIFPVLVESEKIKKALNLGKLPSELGYSELQHCFEKICEQL